ncbi:MAG: glycosyltransferase family 4 protein [Prolixibacteraceae bacterium]|nr:glycosyltransferase family 4 protein [Prolixibacteraceae bacterium]HPN70002.1 glycosyltransferase family 4 protein [Saprospiraceae bacterium]
MEVIYIARFNPFSESSASGNRVRTLLEGLSELGVEICLNITNGYLSRLEAATLGSKGRIGKIRYHYQCTLIHDKLWNKRLYKYFLLPIIYPVIMSRAKRALAKRSNIIVWTDCDFSLFKLVVNLKKKNPNIKTFLEMNEYLDIHKSNKGRLVHRLEGEKRAKYFEKIAYFAYDGIALMTRTLMEHYMQFPQPGPKFIHLPMTVDLERFRKVDYVCSGFEKPYIAFIGVMDNAKDGVNILIHAFAQLAHEFPQYKLYLVGGWNYDTPSHLRLIDKMHLDNRVFWKGELLRDEIPPIIMNANLLVLPRPDSKQAQGGFPTKLGEYLATGHPVCATRVGEIPDYLNDGESVYFAEPGSAISFAEAMRRALRNPDRALIVGLNGRKIAEQFFNKDIQAKTLFMYFEKFCQINQ